MSIPLLSSAVLFLLLAARPVSALQCYQGFDSWGMLENRRNSSLQECPPDSQCCFIFSSFQGSKYGCYSFCPEPGVKQCGPPAGTLMDVGWCYCRSAQDPLCMPAYFQQFG
uniref:Uncharacterized protein n=1 Tax=Plectus sambesii TaxID=2011161 RepID=A0A914WQE4_9BILA